MAQTTTWKVNNMRRNASTGGVDLVYWQCNVYDNDDSQCNSTESSKLSCTPDPSSSDFIAYASLKESDVLGWVYKSLIGKKEDGSDETADEAKARIEKTRQDMVTAQVADKTKTAEGIPW